MVYSFGAWLVLFEITLSVAPSFALLPGEVVASLWLVMKKLELCLGVLTSGPNFRVF